MGAVRLIIIADWRQIATSREETKRKPSIAGTDSCLARITSEKLPGFVLKQGSTFAPFRFMPHPNLNIIREKKYRKNTFDLKQRVHEAEYNQLKRPIDPKTKMPIEPAHKFEVNIESDSFSLTKLVALPFDP